ncbi:MAG: LysM peptidoglycan-binding domain-containing protein [Bacteroidia bacterium]|nr:LysM peptidoglycan-binding domain-containing protein [Bacteroidia bacterium]MCC7532482.1 LysM peptidoglycan-binding domain-containing protein [Bacteroidia bacterium]
MYQKLRFIIITISIGLFVWIGKVKAQPKPTNEFPFKMTVEQYLEKYSEIAVREMHRSRIPASITLAQGLLESGNGNSRLALIGNNHFGIKCKKDWTGETILEDDDEAQECFRKYKTAEESYIDHSDFLMKSQRYALLFDLEPTDYVGWAKGLKTAGYATNPNYPTLLISLIERHNLHRFDMIKPAENKSNNETITKQTQENPYSDIVINNIPAVIAKEKDSYASIALDKDMRVWQIYKYNDLNKDATIKIGDTIYIKPKNYKGSQEFYIVKPNDNMQIISQRFGIKLSKLYKRNLMKPSEEPEVGEKLYLQSNRPTAPKVITPIKETEPTKYDNVVYADPKKNIETTKPELPEDKFAINIPENKDDMAFFHVVQKGETLFSISKRYNVTIEGIMELNSLKSEDIYEGLKLIINPNQAPLNQNEEAVIPGYHIVKQGETLYSIAQKYKTTVNDLRALNELDHDTLKVGEELIIVPLNGEKFASPNQSNKDSNPIYHEVQEGDTLYSIARKYDVLAEDIRKLNNLLSNSISVGQKLRIK